MKPSIISQVDPAKLAKIVELVANGSSINGAARAVGLPMRTVSGWVEAGSAEGRHDPAMEEFALQVRSAEGQTEACAVAVIFDAAKRGDVRAACWFLERKFPGEYRLRTSTEVSGEEAAAGATVKDLMQSSQQRRAAMHVVPGEAAGAGS